MDSQLEEKIIEVVKGDVEKFGRASIKQAATAAFYHGISFSEQKRIAKLLVENQPLVTEAKNDEIFVKKNLRYSPTVDSSDMDYRLIKWIVRIIILILSYFLFKIFLPSLDK